MSARPRRPRCSRAAVAGAAALLVLAGCAADRASEPLPPDVVARTPTATLTVDDAARLLADAPSARADSITVHVLADEWLDHALLLDAVARDTALARFDVAALAAPALDQRLAHKLRETAVRPDTYVTADRLAEFWKEAGTGPETHLQHVLLRWTDAPADSGAVRRRAAAIRDSARAGADFAALARRHSQDEASAGGGGDLGFRGRGRLPAPSFDSALANVAPGQIGDLVESADGVHVVRVVARRYPPVDPDSDFLKLYLRRQRIAAEDAYLDSLVRASRIERRPDRIARARAAVAGGERGDRGVLVSFVGGEVTAGEVRDFVATQPPETQDAFARATDDQVDGAIDQVLWKELLLGEAARRGVTLTAAERDTVIAATREGILARVRAAGVFRPAAQATAADDVGAHAQSMLRASLAGEAPLRPLGALSAFLRSRSPAAINPAAFASTVRRVAELRAAAANAAP